MLRSTCAALLCLATAPLLAEGAPAASPASPAPVAIEVSGAGAPFVVTPEVLKAAPRMQVSVPASEHGPAATFEGVSLRELLTRAGVPTGAAIRGRYLSWVIVVGATDGYQAIFSLAELEADFSNRLVLFADLRDGKPLGEAEGPFRLVVQDDKRPARSVRQVNRIGVGPANIAEEAAAAEKAH